MLEDKKDFSFKEGKKVFSSLIKREKSFWNQIKIYKARAEEVDNFLKKNPNDWGKFQSEFNDAVNTIFTDILYFEKEQQIRKDSQKTDKLKRFFISRLRPFFVRGDYVKHSLKKPYGYAGDFEIIDEIYQNAPVTTGFDRLADNYYQMSSICVAVRNRKDDFKGFIKESIKEKNRNKSVSIMNLASGPCREIKELYEEKFPGIEKCKFHCYEQEKHAIAYAKDLLGSMNQRVSFFELNALKIASLLKEIKKESQRYDVIYSTGLFDYFDYKVSFKLITTLKKLLKKKGVLIIASVRDKFSNPSVSYMEWVGEWNLIYRSDWEFKNVFLDAGFLEKNLVSRHEQQGILQYMIARND